jgi:hypothetical protein
MVYGSNSGFGARMAYTGRKSPRTGADVSEHEQQLAIDRLTAPTIE